MYSGSASEICVKTQQILPNHQKFTQELTKFCTKSAQSQPKIYEDVSLDGFGSHFAPRSAQGRSRQFEGPRLWQPVGRKWRLRGRLLDSTGRPIWTQNRIFDGRLALLASQNGLWVDVLKNHEKYWILSCKYRLFNVAQRTNNTVNTVFFRHSAFSKLFDNPCLNGHQK